MLPKGIDLTIDNYWKDVHEHPQAEENLPEPHKKHTRAGGASVNGILSYPPTLLTPITVGCLAMVGGAKKDNTISRGQEHVMKKLVTYWSTSVA